MIETTGRVVAVNTAPLGDELAADLTVGASVLVVDSAAAFPENGGSVMVADTVIAYTAADDETGELFLVAPSPVAASVGDIVTLWDATTGTDVVETIAHVAVDGDEQADDTLEAVVPHSLIPYLPEGIRDVGEAVLLEQRGDDLYVADVMGQAPVFDGAVIDPATLPPATPLIEAPTTSPAPMPMTGPASVVVNFVPQDTAWADLYVWVAPALAEGETTYLTPADQSITPGPDTLHTEQFPPGGFVSADNSGNPLPPERPVWVALWARNEAGSAPAPSAWVESSAGQIDPAFLQLLAGTIIAQRLIGETVQGVNLTGVTLDILNSLVAGPNYLSVKADVIEAQSAVFADNVTRRGTNNYLEGRETASAGVSDPSNAPTVSNAWKAETWTMGDIVDTEYKFTNELWVLRSSGSIYPFNTYTGTYGAQVNYGPSIFDTRHAISAQNNGTLWVLETVTSFTGPSNLVARKLTADKTGYAGVDHFVIAADNMAGRPAMSIYGDDTIAVIYSNNSGSTRLVEVNIANGNRTLSTLPGGPKGVRDWVGLEFTGLETTVYAQASDATRREWSKILGVWEDSGAMQTRPYGELIQATHSFGDTYGVYTETGTWYWLDAYQKPSASFTYTWYDSDTGGSGVAESKPSPARTFQPEWGADVLVRTPMPPDDGTADAPNTIRLYIDNKRQTPEFTADELLNGRIVTTYGTSGVGAPLTSGFATRPQTTPGGYESGKSDIAGPLWELNGDGSGRVGPLSWTSAGQGTLDYSKTTPANPDQWHTVGTSGQPSWANGWSAFSEPVQFLKTPDGVVFIRGRAAVGTAATIFTLPAGYRPTSATTDIISKAQGTGNFVTIDILTDGSVRAAGYSGASWVSLTLSFVAR